MSDVANIVDFGAFPSPVDSVMAFNAAFATGKPVYVPSGIWSTSPFTIPLSGSRRFFGAGDASVIQPKNTTGDSLTVNGGIVEVDHLWFQSQPQNQSAVIRLNEAGSHVHNCRFSGCPLGVVINHTLCSVSDCQFAPRKDSGVGIDVLQGFAVRITNCDMVKGESGSYHSCIRVYDCGDLTVQNCQLLDAGTPLRFETTQGSIPKSVKVNSSWLGGGWCGVYCATNAVRSTFNDCWFGDNSAHGALIQAGEGWHFTGCQFFGNAQDGMYFNTKNLILTGCHFAGNGNYGLSVNQNVSDVLATGCHFKAGGGLLNNAAGPTFVHPSAFSVSIPPICNRL